MFEFRRYSIEWFRHETVSVQDAIAMIPDGATLMIDGFMAVGTLERLIMKVQHDRHYRKRTQIKTAVCKLNERPGFLNPALL